MKRLVFFTSKWEGLLCDLRVETEVMALRVEAWYIVLYVYDGLVEVYKCGNLAKQFLLSGVCGLFGR